MNNTTKLFLEVISAAALIIGGASQAILAVPEFKTNVTQLREEIKNNKEQKKSANTENQTKEA